MLATPAIPADPVGPVVGAWLGRKSELSIAFKAGLPEVLLPVLVLPLVLLDVLPEAPLPGNAGLDVPVAAAGGGGAGFCGSKPAVVRFPG